ncbi:MAG: hypothetical protein ACC707_02270 [Thiohalomonadales bacterium]
MIKYIAGLAGATAGFLVLKFVSWFSGIVFEFVIFIAVYIFVTISVELTLKRYGQKK